MRGKKIKVIINMNYKIIQNYKLIQKSDGLFYVKDFFFIFWCIKNSLLLLNSHFSKIIICV